MLDRLFGFGTEKVIPILFGSEDGTPFDYENELPKEDIEKELDMINDYIRHQRYTRIGSSFSDSPDSVLVWDYKDDNIRKLIIAFKRRGKLIVLLNRIKDNETTD